MGSYAGCTITLNTSALDALDGKLKQALAMTADAVMTDLKNKGVMPFDSGTMQGDQTNLDVSKQSSGEVSIVTSAPQARRLYFHPEYNFKKQNNRSAGGKWFEKVGTSANVRDIYAKMFRMIGGLS